MATIKSHTDLSQSKKLAEILNHESADMYWDYDSMQKFHRIELFEDGFPKTLKEQDVPAWSLAALLSVLPILERKGYQKAKPRLSYNVIINKWIVDSHVYTTDAYDNPVDACYEMILKLNELKKL